VRPTHDHEQSDVAQLPGRPRVSILVITFNQQDYVAHALASAARRSELPRNRFSGRSRGRVYGNGSVLMVLVA